MITELQLTLFDSYPQAFRVSSQSKTQNVASDDTVTTESQNIRVIEADVIRPDIGVYGKTNRAILNSLEISGFDREKAITDFEGLGIEIQNNNGLAGLYKTRKQNLAQFFTPLQVCRLIVDLLKIPDNATIFDNSCGTGRMAWFLTNPRLFTGIEIEYHAYQIAQKTYPTAQLYNSSFLSLQIPEGVFDYVLVNPPFNLQLTSRDGSMIHINWEGHILSHIASLEIGCQALKKGGLMAAILPRNVWQLESTRKFHQWFLNTMSEVSRIHLPKDAFVGTKWPCTLFIFQKENSWHNDKKREYTLKHLNQTCDLLSWWSTQKLPFSNQTLCGLIAEYALSCNSTEPMLLEPKGIPTSTQVSPSPRTILPITQTDQVTVTCVKGKLSLSPNGQIAALKLANLRANFNEKKYNHTSKRYHDPFKDALNLDPVWSKTMPLEDSQIIRLLKKYGVKIKYTDALHNWLSKRRRWYHRHTVAFEQWINTRPKQMVTAQTSAQLFENIQPGDLLRAKKTVGKRGDDRSQLRIVEGKEYSVTQVFPDEQSGKIQSISAMTETGERRWWASAYEQRDGCYSTPARISDYFDLYRYASEASDWREINTDRGVRTQLKALYHQREKQFLRLCQKYPFLTQLYDFQRDDIIRLSLKDRVIDASQQGLGKTRKAIAVALLKGVSRALFIVPPHLKQNWIDECREINIPLTLISSDRDALWAKQRLVRENSSPRFYLITFTTLKKTYKKGGIKTRKTIADLLKKRFPFIAVDECHHLSNKLSKITKAVKILRAKHKHFMSGTPIGNTVRNIWSLFDILYQSETPLFSYTTSAFRKQFVSVEWVTQEFDTTLSSGRTAQQIPDVLDVKGFTQLIEGKILRRLKSEPRVKRDIAIPKPQLIEIEVIGSKAQFIHYKAHLQHFAELFKRYLNNAELTEHKVDTSVVLAHIQHLQFCATLPQHPKVNLKGEFAYHGGRTQAQEKVIRLIENHTKAGEKVILFTQRPDYCEQMKSWLCMKAIDSEIFTGKVSIDQRNRRLNAFKNGRLQVLLASIRVTDTGLNIPQANVAIIVEPSWKYSEIEQAYSRILRPQTQGQPKVYLIRNKGLIDMYLWQHCVSKQKASAEVLDYQENQKTGGWTHWKDFIVEMLKEEGLM